MFENEISVLKAIKSVATGNAFRRVVAARPDIGNFPAWGHLPLQAPDWRRRERDDRYFATHEALKKWRYIK
jgi:hypothetical protein